MRTVFEFESDEGGWSMGDEINFLATSGAEEKEIKTKAEVMV